MRIYSSAFDVFVGDNKIFTMDRKKSGQTRWSGVDVTALNCLPIGWERF